MKHCWSNKFTNLYVSYQDGSIPHTLSHILAYSGVHASMPKLMDREHNLDVPWRIPATNTTFSTLNQRILATKHHGNELTDFDCFLSHHLPNTITMATWVVSFWTVYMHLDKWVFCWWLIVIKLSQTRSIPSTLAITDRRKHFKFGIPHKWLPAWANNVHNKLILITHN